MRGDTQIGLHALQHSNHRLDVETIYSEPRTRRIPRLIGAVIQETQDVWRTVGERDVRLVVDVLEEFAGVFHRVDVFDEAVAARGEHLL